MTRREIIQKKIIHFLFSNIGKKFSVGDIWEELAGEEDISYSTIQLNIQWLQYQINTPIKTEMKHPYKLVWISKEFRIAKEEEK